MAADQLLFYKIFTPKWLEENAALGFSDAVVTETEFRIPPDVKEHENILQINLLKHGVLNNDDDIVVKVTAGVQFPTAQSDPRDPMIFTLWCPGEDEAMGIQINDPSDYLKDDFGPFRGINGEASSWSISDVEPFGARKMTNWYHFSEMIEFTYAPNSYYSGGRRLPWASGYSAIDAGTFNVFAPYRKNLKLSKGLNFGIYRDKKQEQYILKSLELSIYRNGKDANGK